MGPLGLDHVHLWAQSENRDLQLASSVGIACVIMQRLVKVGLGPHQ